MTNKNELKDDKISYLKEQAKVLLQAKDDDKKYIANFELSLRKSSNGCAKIVVCLIVLLFLVFYIIFLYKLVLPEVKLMFKQTPLYTLFGLVQIILCGGLIVFFFKIPALYKNISNRIYMNKIKKLKTI